LRFGGYQLRYKGQLFERGAFYEPDVLSRDGSDLALLRKMMADEAAASTGERVFLRTRSEFVKEVFYERGYALGGGAAAPLSRRSKLLTRRATGC
jgi:hypothetical protein